MGRRDLVAPTGRTSHRHVRHAQRADACAKGQTRRAAIYDELITSLDTTEAS